MRFLASLGMTGLPYHNSLYTATISCLNSHHKQTCAELRQIDLIFNGFEHFLAEGVKHDDVFNVFSLDVYDAVGRVRVNAGGVVFHCLNSAAVFDKACEMIAPC